MITEVGFKAATSKVFATGRSRQLKAVDRAIGICNRAQTPGNTKALADAIVAWAANKGFKGNGDIDTSRDQPTIRQLIQDVAALPGGQACQNLRNAVLLASPVLASASSGDAYQWVQQKADELKQFSTYACMDASNFPQCIRPDQREAVLQRRDAQIKMGGRPAPPYVPLPGNTEWKPALLKMRYSSIAGSNDPKTRQAECTNFALLAAHVITDGRPSGPRVEIVAHAAGRGSHVFVLVGRVGGHNNGRIPDAWNAVIVDAWAASLGHPCVYKNRGTFPFPGMTGNLTLYMERPAT